MKEPSICDISTTGLALPGGGLLEQLSGSRLLLSAFGEQKVSTSIEHDGKRYLPLPLIPAFDELLCDHFAPYGSLRELIENLSTLVEHHTFLDEEDSFLVASFVLATWVAEFLPSLPRLNLWGPPGSETALRDLLVLLCRRPVTLAEPSLRQLAELPSGLTPTIFLRQPAENVLDHFLAVSSDTNLFYGSRFLRLSSPVVAFTARPVSLPALCVALPQGRIPFSRVSPGDVIEVRKVQPQLLQYRIDHYSQVGISNFDQADLAPGTRVVARILGACLTADATLQSAVVAALKDCDEAAKIKLSQSPEAAVLEGLLVLIHEQASCARVLEITELVNGILEGRHETRKLTPKAVGAIVRRDLGLKTLRRRGGYELLLDEAARVLIHRLAHSRAVLSLLESRPDCAFCPSLVTATPGFKENQQGTPSTSSTPSTPENPPSSELQTNPTAEVAGDAN